MLAPVPPPAFASVGEYAARLGDADAWAAYAEAALRAHGLPAHSVRPTFPGTYPVMRAGGVVVKLFGYYGDWRAAYRAETAAARTLIGESTVPAPRLVASGRLFADDEAPWPYLILTEIEGVAWRDAGLTVADRLRVAAALGAQLRGIHSLPPDPEVPRLDLAGEREAAAARHRTWRTLPDHLLDGVEAYLADYHHADERFVHADLTEDHVFVRDGALAGIIDWGDAAVTDPHYELAALHLGTFRGVRTLLHAVTAGYGWRIDDAFVRRAMQTALLHRFDVFDDVRDIVSRARTLDDLAAALWR